MLAYDRSSTGLWVALIFLVSLNLRPAIAAVGPVLAQMGEPTLRGARACKAC